MQRSSCWVLLLRLALGGAPGQAELFLYWPLHPKYNACMEEKTAPTEPDTTSGIAEHIERRPGVCGGKPCVKGTRIRVWDIHVWHDLRGQSPEEIAAAYPPLSLADVHAALAYYLDHRDAIEKEMKEAEALVARLQAKQGPTRFSKLRDQLSKDQDAESDQVSPG
jgi:uncharacterized protein (DUF433 family)